MRPAVGVAVAVAVAVTVFGAVAFGGMIRRGFSAHDEPSAMEAAMARRTRAWAVPSDLRNEKKPVPPTPTESREPSEVPDGHGSHVH